METTMPIKKDILKEALLKYQIERINVKYPSIEDCNKQMKPNKQTEEKIKKLIKLEKKPYFVFVNTFAKRAACFVIAIFLALTTATLSVVGGAYLFRIISSPPIEGGETLNAISLAPVTVSGVAFTEEQVKKVVDENKENIAFLLQAEPDFNKDIHEIQISLEGYSHVNTGANKNMLDLDYLTLPICANGKIIASVRLFRSDGEIQWTLLTGGEIWATVNQAFVKNPDDDLIFIYINNTIEVILAPNKQMYCVNGNLKDLSFQEGIDYYHHFKTEHNTFSKNKLMDASKFVTVSLSELNVEETKENSGTENQTVEQTQMKENYKPFAVPNVGTPTLVQYSNGYMVMMGKEWLTCPTKQQNEYLEIVKSFQLEPADKYAIPTGGGWHLKLIYAEEDYLIYEMFGDGHVCITKPDGTYAIFHETTGKADSLMNLLISDYRAKGLGS
ncbi:MAG: hypothetical protein GX345_09145 [Clostridiales bacterium]|nr:hypothetical protein [Clostridiales bacterium]